MERVDLAGLSTQGSAACLREGAHLLAVIKCSNECVPAPPPGKRVTWSVCVCVGVGGGGGGGGRGGGSGIYVMDNCPNIVEAFRRQRREISQRQVHALLCSMQFTQL